MIWIAHIPTNGEGVPARVLESTLKVSDHYRSILGPHGVRETLVCVRKEQLLNLQRVVCECPMVQRIEFLPKPEFKKYCSQCCRSQFAAARLSAARHLP
jgi:hypothetical protein